MCLKRRGKNLWNVKKTAGLWSQNKTLSHVRIPPLKFIPSKLPYQYSSFHFFRKVVISTAIVFYCSKNGLKKLYQVLSIGFLPCTFTNEGTFLSDVFTFHLKHFSL